MHSASLCLDASQMKMGGVGTSKWGEGHKTAQEIGEAIAEHVTLMQGTCGL